MSMATYATLVTSLGEIKVLLLPDHAPKTVANFVGLATGTKEWTHPRTGEKKSDSLYAGTIFHRVIPDFMIQGGDPLGQGIGGPGYKFEDEVSGGPSFDGPGYLAMANSGPGTNGSQFFVTVAGTAWLTGKHTIFGKVTEGQEVADKISRVATRSGDRPYEDVVLQEVKITEQD
ncbi:MAG: peptidylprolyl isomerase [Actinomycetota bacterium]